MKRRPFLQKISLLSTAAIAFPIESMSGPIQHVVKLRFIIASDGHFGQENTDFETTHIDLINAINKETQVDFVVFNGDLIHDDPKFLPGVKSFYEQLKSPYYVTRGNHDRVKDQEWKSIWGYPENHCFKKDDHTGIVLLNCSNEAGDYLCADIDFMRNTLTKFKELTHVFIFIHISQNDWTRHGRACEEFLRLAATYDNVKAVFHGHDHDVDGLMWNRGKPYLWDGHFGGSWGNPFPTYRVVEVQENGRINTYLKTIKQGMILNNHTL